MLQQNGIEYYYRDYTREPLSEKELREVFRLLGVGPKELLRKRDKAYKVLGLTGEESEDTLIAHMASHPTLLQRPIGLFNGKAAIGRPVENLLTLVD